MSKNDYHLIYCYWKFFNSQVYQYRYDPQKSNIHLALLFIALVREH